MYETDGFNELADKLAKNLKTAQDISDINKMLTKVAMEYILEIKMECHVFSSAVISPLAHKKG